MRATSYVQHPSHVIEADNKINLLKTTVLYGANASGKSNFISAMFFFEQYIFSQFINKIENEDFESIENQIKIKLEPFYFQIMKKKLLNLILYLFEMENKYNMDLSVLQKKF